MFFYTCESNSLYTDPENIFTYNLYRTGVMGGGVRISHLIILANHTSDTVIILTITLNCTSHYHKNSNHNHIIWTLQSPFMLNFLHQSHFTLNGHNRPLTLPQCIWYTCLFYRTWRCLLLCIFFVMIWEDLFQFYSADDRPQHGHFCLIRDWK